MSIRKANPTQEHLRAVKASIPEKELLLHTSILMETKQDKFEHKVLALTKYKLQLYASKPPIRLDEDICIISVVAVESSLPDRVIITTDRKSTTFTHQRAGVIDSLVAKLLKRIMSIFPNTQLDRILYKVHVEPPERLQAMELGQFNRNLNGLSSFSTGSCGNFSDAYRAYCYQSNQTFLPTVVWDIDNIHCSHSIRELSVKDFTYIMNPRDFLPMVAALRHNTWFQSLALPEVRIFPELVSELCAVLRYNVALEEFKLQSAMLNKDVLKMFAQTLVGNKFTALSAVDFSGNTFDDRSMNHLQAFLQQFTRGIRELRLSRCNLTGKQVSRLLEQLFSQQTQRPLVETLRVLDLSENTLKIDNANHSLVFLLSNPENQLVQLNLASTECSFDVIVTALSDGCRDRLEYLNLSKVLVNKKCLKEQIVTMKFKQFLCEAKSLKSISFSHSRLPVEVIKDLFTGLMGNTQLSNVELDLSGCDLRNIGAEVVGCLLPTCHCISRIDLADNGFNEQFAQLFHCPPVQAGSTVDYSVAKYGSLRHLSIGHNLAQVTRKNLGHVLESLQKFLESDYCRLETFSIADSKLKENIVPVLDALSGNSSLLSLDISGNMMGDTGARQLSKMLQVNDHLEQLFLDRNAISLPGYEEIAHALQRNYSLVRLPIPASDVHVLYRDNSARVDTCFRRINDQLERNRNPHSRLGNDCYRFQQTLLHSALQQVIDETIDACQFPMDQLKNRRDHMSCPKATASAIDQHLARAQQLITDAQKYTEFIDYAFTVARTRNSNLAEMVPSTVDEAGSKLDSFIALQMAECSRDIITKSDQLLGRLFVEDSRPNFDVLAGVKSSDSPSFSSGFKKTMKVSAVNRIVSLNGDVARKTCEAVGQAISTRLTKLFYELKDVACRDDTTLASEVAAQRRSASPPKELALGSEPKPSSVVSPNTSLRLEAEEGLAELDDELDKQSSDPEDHYEQIGQKLAFIGNDLYATISRQRRRPQTIVEPPSPATAGSYPTFEMLSDSMPGPPDRPPPPQFDHSDQTYEVVTPSETPLVQPCSPSPLGFSDGRKKEERHSSKRPVKKEQPKMAPPPIPGGSDSTRKTSSPFPFAKSSPKTARKISADNAMNDVEINFDDLRTPAAPHKGGANTAASPQPLSHPNKARPKRSRANAPTKAVVESPQPVPAYTPSASPASPGMVPSRPPLPGAVGLLGNALGNNPMFRKKQEAMETDRSDDQQSQSTDEGPPKLPARPSNKPNAAVIEEMRHKRMTWQSDQEHADTGSKAGSKPPPVACKPPPPSTAQKPTGVVLRQNRATGGTPVARPQTMLPSMSGAGTASSTNTNGATNAEPSRKPPRPVSKIHNLISKWNDDSMGNHLHDVPEENQSDRETEHDGGP